MRFDRQSAFHDAANTFDFRKRNDHGTTSARDKPAYPWRLEDLKPSLAPFPDKHVAGEKRKSDLLDAVLPLTACHIKREEKLVALILKDSGRGFFVLVPYVQCRSEEHTSELQSL